MVSRATIASVLLGVVGVAVLSACNRTVSQREYIDTAFVDAGYSAPEIYGYVPPDDDRAVDFTPSDPGYRTPPRVIIIGSRDETVRRLDEGGVWISDSPQSNRAFSTNVRNRLSQLDRELNELQAQAEVRGAAAEAAVEPAARDLRMYRRQIQDRLRDMNESDDLDAQWGVRDEIGDLIADAENAMDRAAREVYSIQSND